ncbi:MAG: sigma-70 family RNA polymerase sigma factor [Bacteroidaceae bacterium]|nr:sigma-70 family RNA polymerase sigma factor [Bacteroidaceae bacterium]
MNDIQKLTDEKLVKMYAEGNDCAFDVLLDRYKDRLFSYIQFIVHDEDHANDVFQETFVKVIMAIRQGRYTESGKFYGWLTRIAHNIILDEFRDAANMPTTSDEDTDGALFNDLQLATNSRETEIINEQVLEDVKALMEKLPEEQRRVVFMRIYQDLSFKEIADETGVPLNTALGRMHYALINMRRMANSSHIFVD